MTFLELTEEEAAVEQAENERKGGLLFEEIDAADEPEAAPASVTAEPAAPAQPVQPQPVQPQPTSQVSQPQPAAQSGGTEHLLTQLLEKFSYDVLSAQIRQTVEQQVAVELAKELAARGIDAVSAAATAVDSAISGTAATGSAAASIPVETAPEEPADSGAYDFKLDDTADTEDFYGDSDEEEDDEDLDFFNTSADSDESSGSDFDLMGMLSQLADEMDDITPIDVMDAYGEEVVDISLEDLVKYVKKNIYHQK